MLHGLHREGAEKKNQPDYNIYHLPPLLDFPIPPHQHVHCQFTVTCRPSFNHINLTDCGDRSIHHLLHHDGHEDT